eukprot:406367-Pyramimonas_sp.AAC.1
MPLAHARTSRAPNAFSSSASAAAPLAGASRAALAATTAWGAPQHGVMLPPSNLRTMSPSSLGGPTTRG